MNTNATILFVEDDERVRTPTEEFLTIKGFLVLPYSGCRKAVEAIEYGLKYDICITDLSLPDGSAEEILVASKRAHPTVPVWTFSGYPYGIKNTDGHFDKRYGLEKLLARLKDYQNKE